MKFRTEIEDSKLPFEIDHSKKGLSLGSCFADNMALRLSSLRFAVRANSFGVVYNPSSLCQSIERLSEDREFTEEELFEYNSLYHSELHHGDFSCENPEQALDKINSNYKLGVKALKESDYLIITLGTAWVYKNAQSGAIVSNCHKRPARDFVRERLSVEQIVEMFSKLLTTTLQSKDIILTVSPIRHLKDGLQQNSLSKSTLIVACHTLCERFKGRVHYFPSYEIMNDDLRDYRFYKSDMLHPSEQAVEYIWDKFSACCMSEKTLALLAQLEVIRKGTQHRVMKPQSDAHQAFCKSMLAKIEVIKVQNPNIDLSENEHYFASFLKK